MKLVYPLNELLEDVLKGELVIVEYDSVAQFPLLPLELARENDGTIVIFGDKLSVKVSALNVKSLKNLKIVNVSNYAVNLEGIEVFNVPIEELLSVISNVYDLLKKFARDGVVVMEGLEVLTLYFDTKNILKNVSGIKVMLPNSTMFIFSNYEVIEKKLLSFLESMATTVVRFKGFMKRDSIDRYGYVVKSLKRPKATVKKL